MHQLDVHINARCRVWQEQVSLLTNQLESTQQEVGWLQQELQVKTAKVGKFTRILLPWKPVTCSRIVK